MTDLRLDFPEAYQKLLDLYPRRGINPTRLNEIYAFTEEKWNDNLKHMSNHKVRYLLIAEAAPWSKPNDPITYFYGKCNSKLHNTIISVFKDCALRPLDDINIYPWLAEIGFVMIDTLPFSEHYSPNKRKSEEFKELVRLCSKSYFHRKINQLKWDDEVKVAIAYKYHGYAVLEAFENQLPLPNGQTIELSNRLIVTDDSGNPNPSKMRNVFFL